MAEIKLNLDGYKCERCNHEWIARGKEKPIVCPKCKSPYWNIPKKKWYRDEKKRIPLISNGVIAFVEGRI